MTNINAADMASGHNDAIHARPMPANDGQAYRLGVRGFAGKSAFTSRFFLGSMETHMTPITRRTFLVGIAVAPISHAALVHAVDALPDARFVGFAETVNDFEIKSGQLALTKSSNELVRGYATRAVAEHTTAAQSLSRNRAEAGVSMAPDETVRKIADDAMTRLNSLQGAEFDTAFAAAQLRVQTAAVDQYGAYSQNGKSGPLRRYAQETLPKSQSFLEYAKRLAAGR